MDAPATPLSLNEISFVFTRAAVGAGAPFGIGEEFARACAWLGCLGFDPAAAAAPALRGLADGTSTGELVLRDGRDAIRVRARDGRTLSAIYAGPVVADRLSADARTGGGRVGLDKTDQPLLIAAAVVAAELDASPVAVSWPSPDGGRIVVELTDGMARLGGPKGCDFAAGHPARVDVVPGRPAVAATPSSRGAARGLAHGRRRAIEHGVAVDDVAWQTVLSCFRKCLVPSTAQSRSRGAGAGAIDNA